MAESGRSAASRDDASAIAGDAECAIATEDPTTNAIQPDAVQRIDHAPTHAVSAAIAQLGDQPRCAAHPVAIAPRPKLHAARRLDARAETHNKHAAIATHTNANDAEPEPAA